MTSIKSITRFGHIQCGILLALCIGLGGAKPAAASIIYDFSLPANGAIGAIDVQLTFPSFVTGSSVLNVYPLSAPPVSSFSSGTALSAASSVEGFEVTPSSSLIGLRLVSPSSAVVLFTTNFPADFFSFARTANQTGTFTAIGNVTSDLALSTARPTARLVVSDTTSVPEPATGFVLGLGLFALAGCRICRRFR